LFVIGADFRGADKVAPVLGENIFYGPGLGSQLRKFSDVDGGAVFAYWVAEPSAYGVVAFDADGTAISLIQSLYMGFGSGCVAPGTGVVLQNRGACFVETEGPPNRPAPARRPFHPNIPGMPPAGLRLPGPFGVMWAPDQAPGVGKPRTLPRCPGAAGVSAPFGAEEPNS